MEAASSPCRASSVKAATVRRRVAQLVFVGPDGETQGGRWVCARYAVCPGAMVRPEWFSIKRGERVSETPVIAPPPKH